MLRRQRLIPRASALTNRYYSHALNYGLISPTHLLTVSILNTLETCLACKNESDCCTWNVLSMQRLISLLSIRTQILLVTLFLIANSFGIQTNYALLTKKIIEGLIPLVKLPDGQRLIPLRIILMVYRSIPLIDLLSICALIPLRHLFALQRLITLVKMTYCTWTNPTL